MCLFHRTISYKLTVSKIHSHCQHSIIYTLHRYSRILSLNLSHGLRASDLGQFSSFCGLIVSLSWEITIYMANITTHTRFSEHSLQFRTSELKRSLASAPRVSMTTNNGHPPPPLSACSLKGSRNFYNDLLCKYCVCTEIISKYWQTLHSFFHSLDKIKMSCIPTSYLFMYCL